MSLVDLIATAPASDPRISRGILLLIIFAAGGFGLVFALAMGSAIRHGRRTRKRLADERDSKTDRRDQPDAWGEAGRRMDPKEGDHWIPDKRHQRPDDDGQDTIDDLLP